MIFCSVRVHWTRKKTGLRNYSGGIQIGPLNVGKDFGVRGITNHWKGIAK